MVQPHCTKFTSLPRIRKRFKPFTELPYELILKGLRQITGKEVISQKMDFPPEKSFCGIFSQGSSDPRHAAGLQFGATTGLLSSDAKCN
jgi:hypothetical protein